MMASLLHFEVEHMSDGNPRSVTGLVVGLVVVGVIALAAGALAWSAKGRNQTLLTRIETIEGQLKAAGITKGKAKKAAAAPAATPPAGTAAKRRKPATGASTKPATVPAAAPKGDAATPQ
jgi:hypothetical protein